MIEDLYKAAGLAMLGIALGLGRLLAGEELLTARVVVGRALVSGGLGLSAAGILAFMPELPFYAQMGIAAAIASLGTSGVEMLLQRTFGR